MTREEQCLPNEKRRCVRGLKWEWEEWIWREIVNDSWELHPNKCSETDYYLEGAACLVHFNLSSLEPRELYQWWEIARWWERWQWEVDFTTSEATYTGWRTQAGRERREQWVKTLPESESLFQQISFIVGLQQAGLNFQLHCDWEMSPQSICIVHVGCEGQQGQPLRLHLASYREVSSHWR